MSGQYNKIVFVGYLGKDPEMRYTKSGKPVTGFSVASNDNYMNAEGIKETITTWFSVSVWGGQAEACSKYLHKGNKVLVEGRLDPDPKTGSPKIWKKKDGKAGTSFNVTAWSVYFLDSKPEGSDEQPAGDDDDIPF